MIDSLLALVLLVELVSCILACYRLQPVAMDFGEACTRALALPLVGLGLVIQLLFVLHLAHAPWLVDLVILGLNTIAWKHGCRRFFPDLREACRTIRSRASAWLLLGAFCLLAGLVWITPPTNWDSMTYNLARVLLMMHQNTLAPEHYSTFRQLSFSPGFDLLHFFFLRYGTDRGIAAFSWLAYLLIAVGSFTLAKRHGQTTFALHVALVVCSLPLLVLEATSTKNDIGAAAMAVACLVGAARLCTRADAGTLAFLVACFGYGCSTKSHFMLFGLPLFFLVGWHRRREIMTLLGQRWRTAPLRLGGASLGLAAVLALSLASQGIDLARFGNPFGPPSAVTLHENIDGLRGATANLTRYALDVVDVPGKWWFIVRRDLHARLFGPGKGPGASMPFHALYALGNSLREDSAWFGPLGGLLLLPCILAGLFRKNDPLCRITALSLLAFFAGVTFKITWFTYNNRFFTLFFAASAPCLAAARTVWHDRRWLRLPILGLAAGTFILAVLANQDHPLLDARYLPDVSPPFEASIFDRPGGRRGVYDAYFHGPLLLDYLSHGIFPGGKALLVAGKDSWVYPILFYGRAQNWLVLGRETPQVRLEGQNYDIRDCAALHQLAARFDVTVIMEDAQAKACLADRQPVMTTRANWGDVAVFAAGRNAR